MQERQWSTEDVQDLRVHAGTQRWSGPRQLIGYGDVSKHVVGGVKTEKHGRHRHHHPERTLEGPSSLLHHCLLNSEQMCDLVGETAKSDERKNVSSQGEAQAVVQ